MRKRLSALWGYIPILLCMLFAETMLAQNTMKITGTVKDKQGEVIIGANVMQKGTTNGVITGMDGDFTWLVMVYRKRLT